MSTYDDASLVLVPSGYKNGIVFSQKPMDANGQLTFTRASSATRVQSDGLIEKVRTNLALQSQTFDNASWTKTTDGQVTITANAAVAPDGTTTAEKMIPSAIAGFHCVAQTITLSASETSVSIFAKAAEYSFLQIFDSLTTEFANFNLTTGVVGSTNTYVASIESVGNGWYRCKATKAAPSGSFTLRYGVVTSGTAVRGESFTGNGTDGLLIWGAQAETGVTTDYIPTTTAAVSVGPVSGLPRLDYLNSSCPKLLLEPQRTNLALFSEQMNNAYWSTLDATVSANAFTSPTGENSADAIVGSGTGTIVRLSSTTISGTLSASHTASCFLKKGTNNFALFQASVTGATGVTFAYVDLVNGTSPQSGVTIQDYGNDWYRVSFTFTLGATFANIVLRIFPTLSTTTTAFATNADALNKSVLAWGCQLEASASYASSYIPTLGASVTRVADAASKTGISSLIGQTEGSFYAEWEVTQADGGVYEMSLSDGSASNAVRLRQNSSNTMQLVVASSGAVVASISSGTTIVVGQQYKLAAAYKLNDFVFYLNGTQVGSDSSGAVPATLTSIGTSRGDGNFPFYGELNQALVFKTRLTNDQLAELTSL